MKWSRLLQRWRHESDAGPIVEFAIVVPVIVLIIYLVVDVARAITQQSNLVSAVREAARYASVMGAAPCDSVTQIKSRARSAFSSFGDTLPTSLITVESVPSGCPTTGGYDMRVTVQNFPFRSKALPSGTIQLAARARFRWERGS